ncbi:EamA family transporter [Tsukamurella pulmonis]|uniref:EamA family transporter n=2 Tax=Tsukamurella pulmonis TaxID=47312 RepID=UPI0009E970C4|nr:EamA family transporter [Tsukamurella pulmonis]
MTPRHRLVALFVVVLWGLNFLAIRYGLDYFPPLFLGALRFLVLALPVLLFVRPPKGPVKWLLLYGIGSGTFQFGLLFTAMHIGMPTGLASLVLQSSAPFTVLLGAVLLHEKLAVRQIVGIGIAVVGMGLIIADRADAAAGVGVLGVALTLLGGLSWAFGNIGQRLAAPSEPFRFTLWMSVIPPLPMLALSAAVEGPTTGWKALAHSLDGTEGRLALLGVAYIAILSTVVGYGLWGALMARYPASTVAPATLLVPVIGIAASAVVLGEHPTALALAGAGTVIAGCLLGMLRRPSPLPGGDEGGGAGRELDVTVADDLGECGTQRDPAVVRQG